MIDHQTYRDWAYHRHGLSAFTTPITKNRDQSGEPLTKEALMDYMATMYRESMLAEGRRRRKAIVAQYAAEKWRK